MLFRYKFISYTANGMYVLRFFGIWFDFFSQIAYVNHYGSYILVDTIGVPKAVKDLMTCKNSVGIFAEKNQKFELFGGEMECIALEGYSMGGKIYFQISGGKDVVGSIAVRRHCLTVDVAAAQMCLDTSHKLCRAERFGNIIVTPY